MSKTKTLWVDIKSTTWERYSIIVDENESLEEIGCNVWDYDPDYEDPIDNEVMTVNENNGYSTLEIREDKYGPIVWENGKSI